MRKMITLLAIMLSVMALFTRSLIFDCPSSIE